MGHPIRPLTNYRFVFYNRFFYKNKIVGVKRGHFFVNKISAKNVCRGASRYPRVL
jgi:hypothetical protein